jgi:hypothetical protein
MKFITLFVFGLLSACLGCHEQTQEERVAEAHSTIQNLLDNSVALEVDSTTTDIISQQKLFRHGRDGEFGTDYTLCGSVRVDHIDHFFIVTMRMANLNKMLGQTPVQILTPKGVADKLTGQFCSNSDTELPPNLEPDTEY